MSTTSIRNQGNFSEIIVRGYRDRPTRLRMTSKSDRSVEAVGADDQIPMPFHIDRVFCYEDGLFRRLSDAFASGDTSTLAALWSQANPIE
jgi:hypothetical protein